MEGRTWRLVVRHSDPFLLERPWGLSLTAWPDARMVEVARGNHRHVVRFIADGERIFALKELPGELAMREYRLLRQMAEDGLPVVDVVGVVQREGLPDVLITRYLDFSLPYRHLYLNGWGAGASTEASRDISMQLLDALSLLLVRLHLGGFFWGDCSLNNTLLKRDAGALAAYVVDMETGEYHEALSDGQRMVDVEIAETNLAGGLLDVAAELGVDIGVDPVATAMALRRSYDALWEELTREEVVAADERYRIHDRIRRLNDLGFHVDEVEVKQLPEGGGGRLRLRTSVTEQGHHRRRLADLTGIRAQENQARQLLNDMASYRSWLEGQTGRSLPTSAVAFRWLEEVYDPIVQAIPDRLRRKREPVEVFADLLRWKWLRSEEAGHDIGMQEALEGYLSTELPAAPDEKVVLPEVEDAADGWIGFG